MNPSIPAMVFVGVLACGGCGSDEPVDASGNYTINVTNRENGCGFSDWTEGQSSANIPVVISQEGTDASARVDGLTGGFLSLVLGSSTFEGGVSGNSLSMEIVGTKSATEGNCTYTLNATLDADLNGDVLLGDVLYTAATNDNSDCAALEGCTSRQELNGTRPPQ